MKFLDLLRFVESINGMFNLRLWSTICDWGTEDCKLDVNNHTNVLNNLDVIYPSNLMCRLTTCAPLINDNL